MLQFLSPSKPSQITYQGVRPFCRNTPSWYLPARWRSGKSVCFVVGRPVVHFPSRVTSKNFLKMVFTASLLGAQQIGIVWRTSRKACLLQDTKRDASVFMWQTGGGAKQSTRRGGPNQTENLQTEHER